MGNGTTATAGLLNGSAISGAANFTSDQPDRRMTAAPLRFSYCAAVRQENT